MYSLNSLQQTLADTELIFLLPFSFSDTPFLLNTKVSDYRKANIQGNKRVTVYQFPGRISTMPPKISPTKRGTATRSASLTVQKAHLAPEAFVKGQVPHRATIRQPSPPAARSPLTS